MATAIREFLNGERAQDLVEYSLLLGLVVIGSAALMLNSGGPISNVWSSANSTLRGSANTVPSTVSSPTSTTTAGTVSGGTVTSTHHDDGDDNRH